MTEEQLVTAVETWNLECRHHYFTAECGTDAATGAGGGCFAVLECSIVSSSGSKCGRAKGNRTVESDVLRTWNPGPGVPLEMS